MPRYEGGGERWDARGDVEVHLDGALIESVRTAEVYSDETIAFFRAWFEGLGALVEPIWRGAAWTGHSKDCIDVAAYDCGLLVVRRAVAGPFIHEQHIAHATSAEARAAGEALLARHEASGCKRISPYDIDREFSFIDDEGEQELKWVSSKRVILGETSRPTDGEVDYEQTVAELWRSGHVLSSLEPL